MPLSYRPQPATSFRLTGGLLSCLTRTAVGFQLLQLGLRGWSRKSWRKGDLPSRVWFLKCLLGMASGCPAPHRGTNIPCATHAASLWPRTQHHPRSVQLHVGRGLPASALRVLGTQFMCVFSGSLHVLILEMCKPSLGVEEAQQKVNRLLRPGGDRDRGF